MNKMMMTTQKYIKTLSKEKISVFSKYFKQKNICLPMKSVNIEKLHKYFHIFIVNLKFQTNKEVITYRNIRFINNGNCNS